MNLEVSVRRNLELKVIPLMVWTQPLRYCTHCDPKVDSPVHLYKDSVVYEDPFLRFQGKDELQTAFNILGLLFSSIRITRYAPFWKTNQLLRIYNVQEYTLKVGLTLVIPPKIDLVFGTVSPIQTF
mmetsp:Transcript_21504/g.87732  ORF Transcript_21504/g.87732 Transcript_21504/m.87732 type:complete len:126 (+) Transcript_21504:346-723(+)